LRDDTGDLTGRAVGSEETSDASASGKTCRIGLAGIEGKSGVGIDPDCVGCLGGLIESKVARVVGSDDDVAVFLGGVFEKGDRQFAPCAGVKGVDYGPRLFWGVVRGQVEGVGLGRIFLASNVVYDLPGWQAWGGLAEEARSKHQEQYGQGG
jgi:hypothetical protein